ncbi:MAG: carboxypeptidase regulatory-like domain-containing protein [Bryobacteraceae bacterium]
MSTIALAQRDLGTVTGTVSDAQGAAVPNAKVTISDETTGVSIPTQTNDSGIYTLPTLRPGTYDVTVEASGFQKAQQKGIVVNPGAPTAVNITMQVGNVNQTVEVTAAAPLLQTQSPAMGTNLNASQISDLPLGGQRTFTFLARMTPGVVPAESGARGAAGGDFSAGGVRSTGENNFLLNGIDNNVNVIDFINQTSFVIGPSVDAIGNMQIITTGASAEYGRAAGGVMDINIKSGTNQVHGVLFEILQNTVLDANRWENNLAGTARNPFKQNQFGGAVGFPIIKNKLFMFGDYQGTRIRTAGGAIPNLGTGGFFTIPTPAMVHGDFSQLLGSSIGTDPATGQNILQNEIFDPRTTTCLSGCLPGTLTSAPGASPVYTRAPFPGNKIPITAMDPASVKLASLYPAPNQPIAPGNYPQNDFYEVTPASWDTDQGDGRVDYSYNDSNSIFGSISWSNTSKTGGPLFPGVLDGTGFYGLSEQDLGRNAMISWSHIFSPSFISESRVGFSRLVTARLQPNATTDAFAAAGIGGYNPTGAAASNGGIPQIGLNRYTQVGTNDWLPTKEYSNEWDFIENLSLTKGVHSFKFGAEFRPFHFPFFQVPFPHGEMNFTRNETAFPSQAKDSGGQNGTLNQDTGDELASFLLGSINNGQISTTNFISSTKQAYAFYAQDDWKVTPKLTLNLGVRYELFSPIGEQFGRQSNFVLQDLTLYIPYGPNEDAPLPPNFNKPATVNGITFPALFPNVTVDRAHVSPYLIPWDKLDIGPRMGFAYNIFPKIVIRGAYGIYYGGEENQGGNPNRGESAPFNLSPQLNRPSGVGIFQPDPFFANGNPTGGVSVGSPTNVFTGFPVSSLQFREVATDFRNPMIQKWNLAIQQELPGQMALEIGYLGNHQSHQLLQPDFNNCPNLGTTNSSITCNTLRRYTDIGSISGTATWGFGNYNALTAQLEKRMSSGLQFVAAYTYSHALANSGTTLSGSPGLGLLDPTNWATSYANASWDIRHNFTSGIDYQLPFGRGKQYGANLNRVVDSLLGNWELNAIITVHTGQPYTLRASGCQGVWSRCQPELAPGTNPNAAPPGGRTPTQWFNTANILSPAPLTGGNLGLQTNFGPPTRNLDLSIFKDFPFTERFKVQFRAEAYNLTNTPQFSFPDNTLGDTKFGQVTSTQTGSERHIQFALRLQF